MHYVADDTAIRDAKQEAEKAKYELKIAEIEKSISNLEEVRDKQTNAIDEMVSNLEAYKDAWSDIASAYEEEQENLIIAQILGADWETDILNGRLDVLDSFKNQYISLQQAMADAAWKSANEQIKAAKEAEKGASGLPSNAPKIDGNSDKDTPPLKAYASGINGLPHDEKNALVSEYGQTEMTVLPSGRAVITDEPTLMDLPKDTVIYNEEQTKQIIDNKVNVSGNAYADGTSGGNWWIGADGHRYRDLQPGDRGYDLMKAGQAFIEKWKASGEEFISNAYFAGQKQLEQLTKEITNNTAISNIVNNNRNIQQPVVNQNVTINCPNVTNDSGVEHLQQQLGHLSLMATQVPLRDY